MVDFETVQRSTIPDQVAAAIRGKILSGELPPGYHLREMELAEQLGVSRGVLREAFRQLMGERLLVTLPHRGTFIWQPNRQELEELATLRAGMEGMCVRLILTAGKSQEMVSALSVIVDEMGRAEAAGEPVGPTEQRFHETIVQLSGNQQIWRVWKSVHPSVWLFNLPALLPQGWSAVNTHRALVEELRQATTPLEGQEAAINHILEGLKATVGGSRF